jgi:hypothetical protein
MKKEIATTPLYVHDCESCIFLGDYDDGTREYDLYFCPTGGLHSNSVIARYGENEKYLSGTRFAISFLFEGEIEHPLAVALMRTYQKDLITVNIETNE